jgi:hypothetical protein
MKGPGMDYRVNIGRAGGGSLVSSYGGEVNIGEVDQGTHVRDFGKYTYMKWLHLYMPTCDIPTNPYLFV